MKFVEYVFVVAFLSAMTVGLCALTYVIVIFLLTPLIHMCGWKSFGEYQNPAFLALDKKIDKEGVRLTALDFVLRESLKRKAQEKQRLEELLNPKPHTPIKPHVESPSWDLEAMAAAATELIIPQVSQHVRGESQPLSKDLWGIAKTAPSGKVRFLCFKLSQRDRGLRVAFAAIPSKACRMNRAAAFRWAAVMNFAPGIECRVVPLNAEARIRFRNEQKEITQREVLNEATSSATA